MKTGRRAMLARMFAVWLPLGTVALAPAPGFGQQFNISTLAGTGDEGFNGDGETAVQADLDNPSGVAVDRMGNVYFADTFNHRIRRVDLLGAITTIAGTGEDGFNGDIGPAAMAQLDRPFGVAVDSAGIVYFADAFNHRIRRVDPSGAISTIAGAGGWGYGGDGGPAIAARLDLPTSVAVDEAGNVYFADTENDRIRRVDPSGVIATVAGTGQSGFNGDGGPAVQAQLDTPYGVAVDKAGNVFVADTFNHRIRRVDSSGAITTIAGNGERGFGGDGGPAVEAQLNEPRGVAVDAGGAVYFSDEGNDRIRRVDPSGSIATVAGTEGNGFNLESGPADQAQMDNPEGVAVDVLGNVYFADTFNERVRMLSPTGEPFQNQNEVRKFLLKQGTRVTPVSEWIWNPPR